MKYLIESRYNFWIAWTIAVVMIITFRINKNQKQPTKTSINERHINNGKRNHTNADSIS